jgi:hypothetical protein
MTLLPTDNPYPGTLNDPFVWGRGGRRKSLDDLALERRLAMQQLATGSDFSPVQHWTQGLARVANGLAGGIRMRQTDKAADEARTAQQSIIEALLAGPMEGQPDPIAAALADPELRPLGMSVLESRQPKAAQPTEFSRLLTERGIAEGSPEWNQAYDRYIAGKSDPQVTVTLPGGGIFVGPQSELSTVLQGGAPSQSARTYPPPPQEAVLDLLQNPDTAAQFDEIFGPGSSAQVFAARQGFREFTGR